MSANRLPPTETFEVRIEGFRDLPARTGVDYSHSAEFECFGHLWCLEIWPGGLSSSSSARGKVALYLCNQSAEPIEVEATFIVKKAEAAAAYYSLGKYNYLPSGIGTENSQGLKDFADRTALLDALQNGALTIHVQMMRAETTAMSACSFVPENPLSKQILAKFLDEESADVVFEVGGSRSHEGGRKRAKVSATTFHAHRFVLQQCSSTLGDLCKSLEGALPTVQISDVDSDIFRHLLHYCYGGVLTDEDLKTNAKEIIDAADKYGVVNLKLQAEASLVESTQITIENVMDNLLYADGKNCALLKEAVMDFIVENGDDAVEKLSFDDFPGHLAKDLLVAVNWGKKKGSDSTGFRKMRVAELRKILHEEGLDIDGSREMMIARLEANSDRASED